MRMEEGKSVNEIAQELGISPKTVETQIARAKSFLKEHVSDLL
jgi:DNA-binding NarL/FixJ family response regulator